MSKQPNILVCFGDSNTHGSAPMKDPDDIHRFGLRERWTSLLAIDLGPRWSVLEEGLPGRTTVHPDPIEGAHMSGIRRRFRSSLEAIPRWTPWFSCSGRTT